MEKLKSIYASSYSASLAIIVVTFMTLYAELSPSFKSWLAEFTGHHWVTKSLITVLAYILFFVVFRFMKKIVNESNTKMSVFILLICSILGFVTILGFYVYEFLAH